MWHNPKIVGKTYLRETKFWFLQWEYKMALVTKLNNKKKKSW